MPAALTNGQKAYLAQLAARAWRASAEADSLDEEGFRHQEVVRACGKVGLRCCSQDDYGLVKGHFISLLGEPGRGMNAMVHGAGNPKRVAMFKLRQACAEAGVNMGYAEAICRRQNHGAGLEDMDDKGIWRLVFTVRNRGASRREKEAA